VTTQGTSRIAALLETALMVAVLLSYIWGWEGTFAGASALIGLMYFGVAAVSHVRRGETLRQLGFRTDNLPTALRNAAIVVLPAVAIALAAGLALGGWHFPSWRRALAGLPWTLLWATAQQYGLVAFFYRRFLEIFGRWQAAVLAAAMMFATFHLPNRFLIAVTLAAGTAACTLYRREPNVIALALAHAMLSYVLFFALPQTVTHNLHVGPGYYATLR
jgi:hypothetical protein